MSGTIGLEGGLSGIQFVARNPDLERVYLDPGTSPG